MLRRRHTEASFSDKSILPSREEIYKWQTSFEHLLRHKCKLLMNILKTNTPEKKNRQLNLLAKIGKKKYPGNFRISQMILAERKLEKIRFS